MLILAPKRFRFRDSNILSACSEFLSSAINLFHVDSGRCTSSKVSLKEAEVFIMP